MVQHVAIEVHPDDIRRSVEFWTLLGFTEVPEPEPLRGRFTWVEREGTQIHFMHETSPVVPPRAHVAVVVDDVPAACERLEAAGFETGAKRTLWGATRAFAVAPGGHQVELMDKPPPRAA